MPTYLIIVIIAVVFALMGVQTILTKRKSPFWGLIIPVLIVATGIYFYFFRNIEVNYKNVAVFAVPLVWCLIENAEHKKLKKKFKK